MKIGLGICFLVLLSTFTLASTENLYQQDTLTLDLLVNGSFELTTTGSDPSVREVSTKIMIVPQDDFRQKVLEFNSEGQRENTSLFFTWTSPQLTTHPFGYRTQVRTNNQRKEVRDKILFPIDENRITNLKDYTLPTTTIDSDNFAIIAQASELAAGETDLFKVTFNLANWVGENVRYDLNTLTETASQKASWVLENKQGVCDEMTSLFVAMARSLGIPARFVSGISYTNSPLFGNDHWQPHGWAEVYFPDIGWVSFDIAFGEYGYVDVTHIKLRDGADPTQAATQYEWRSRDVNLQSQSLEFDVEIVNEGDLAPQELELASELLDENVGPLSYNLIKGIVKNKDSFYSAATLELAIPKEVEIIGKNKRTIMLAPKEVRETFWVIKVKDILEDGFEYRFPIMIYSEKNISVSDSFMVSSAEKVYSRKEIEERIIKDEEKSYSRKITLTCQYPQKLKKDQNAQSNCSLKNSGNTNLKDVNFCTPKGCEQLDLLINQEKSNQFILPTQKMGWNSLVVSAENDQIEKKLSLEYLVEDSPDIKTTIQVPSQISYGDSFTITTTIEKISYSTPQKVQVTLEGVGMKQEWSLDQLSANQDLILKLEQAPLSWNNELLLTTIWEDKAGEKFETEQEIVFKSEGNGFLDSIKMFFNLLINRI